MTIIFKLLIDCLLVSIIIYSKVSPYRDQLSIENKKRYDFVDKIISPIHSKISALVHPLTIGKGISLDLSHIYIMAFLILLITFI